MVNYSSIQHRNRKTYVMDIQATLIGHELDRDKLIAGFNKGIDGDLEHMRLGRSAPAFSTSHRTSG